MPHSYPPPTALPKEVEKVRTLYRERYGVELGFDETKRFLEGAAQFVYLTEVDRELADVGGVRDPFTGRLGFENNGLKE